MRTNTTKNFENKLKAYSALAAGVTALAAAGTAQGQIVYTDVNPDRTLTAAATADTMNIDMNHDGTVDFQFSLRTYGTANVQANLYPADPSTGQVLGSLVSYTSLGYITALALNDPISASLTWNAGVGQWILASVYNGTNYGNLGDGAEHYIGVYFGDGTNTYYGWIRVSGVPATGANVTVMDYAYNTTAGAQILAGQMTVGIDDANTLAANIFSTDKKVVVNTEVANGTISIYSTTGQLIRTTNIENNHTEINMNDVATGIYMVKVQSGENTIVKRVNL